MADIFFIFPVQAAPETVFEAISTAKGLNSWWTLECMASTYAGEEYTFYFGPEYNWKARVLSSTPGEEIEWEFTSADQDWTGTRLGFRLKANKNGATDVHFHHTGWPQQNDHFRISSFCWAMYLRLLKKYAETGEVVPYAARLDA